MEGILDSGDGYTRTVWEGRLGQTERICLDSCHVSSISFLHFSVLMR
jgi:hypothetical protein